MTENVDNLILEHLRGLRNQVEGLQTEMQVEFRDVKQRLSHLETITVGLKRDGVEGLADGSRSGSNSPTDFPIPSLTCV